MVSSLKSAGLIYAYIDWRVVDETGQLNKNGHYVYVNDIWIAPLFQKKQTLKLLIAEMNGHEYMSDVAFVYWNNLKHSRRATPLYMRHRLLDIIGVKTGEMTCSKS